MVNSSTVTSLILTCWMGMFSLVEGAEKLKLKSDTHVVLVGNGDAHISIIDEMVDDAIRFLGVTRAVVHKIDLLWLS